jgi:hypothetical protein
MPISKVLMTGFRIEKERAEATLTLSNGLSVRGCVFVAAGSPTHDGRERTKDVLNAAAGFFPFEVREHGSRHTALYHRDHVMFVTLHSNDEPSQEPGYEVAVTRNVSMLLADGTRLHGCVRVYCPAGRDRLSDYARSPEMFRYLESPTGTYIINTRHIVELRETEDS